MDTRPDDTTIARTWFKATVTALLEVRSDDDRVAVMRGGQRVPVGGPASPRLRLLSSGQEVLVARDDDDPSRPYLVSGESVLVRISEDLAIRSLRRRSGHPTDDATGEARLERYSWEMNR